MGISHHGRCACAYGASINFLKKEKASAFFKKMARDGLFESIY